MKAHGRNLFGSLALASLMALGGCASGDGPDAPPPADRAEQDFEDYECPECVAPGTASVDEEEAD